MSRAFVLILVGLFVAASSLAWSDPPDSPWVNTVLVADDDTDVDSPLDEIVDCGPCECDTLIPSSSRTRLSSALTVANRLYSATPHAKRAPPVL